MSVSSAFCVIPHGTRRIQKSFLFRYGWAHVRCCKEIKAADSTISSDSLHTIWPNLLAQTNKQHKQSRRTKEDSQTSRKRDRKGGISNSCLDRSNKKATRNKCTNVYSCCCCCYFHSLVLSLSHSLSNNRIDWDAWIIYVAESRTHKLPLSVLSLSRSLDRMESQTHSMYLFLYVHICLKFVERMCVCVCVSTSGCTKPVFNWQAMGKKPQIQANKHTDTSAALLFRIKRHELHISLFTDAA